MDLALLDFLIMKFPFPAQLHVVWSYVFVDILNAVEFNNIDMWTRGVIAETNASSEKLTVVWYSTLKTRTGIYW